MNCLATTPSGVQGVLVFRLPDGHSALRVIEFIQPFIVELSLSPAPALRTGVFVDSLLGGPLGRPLFPLLLRTPACATPMHLQAVSARHLSQAPSVVAVPRVSGTSKPVRWP